MADDLAIVTKDNWTTVQRLRQMPVLMIETPTVLADFEAISGRESATDLAHWR
jgi:hypothetical protein